MIDTDIIAHLDSQTGLPAVDLRSPAQRWFESLDGERMPELDTFENQDAEHQ